MTANLVAGARLRARMSRFEERLAEGGVVVGDGGTGALLSAAVPRLRCPEEANLKAPEAVIGVHAGFIRAGADLIETNTFGANRRKLSAQYLDDRLEEIVERGVKLAREAREVAGVPVLVGGAIGPLGDLEGTTGAEDAYAVFHEQARLLEGRGVDLFLVETFYDLDELETAIRAVQDVSSLPIVAQLTFDEDGQTLAGVQARDAVVRLQELGVAAAGANCGLGPQAALAALGEMSAARERAAADRAAERRAAEPLRRAHRLPARDAGLLRRVRRAGPQPGRAADRRLLRDDSGADRGHPCGDGGGARAARGPLRRRARGRAQAGAGARARRCSRSASRRGSGSCPSSSTRRRGRTWRPCSGVAARLRDSGEVHAVDINDNPMARARLSALMAATVIERSVALETIPHVTPRDASIMGLQSQLLGAHAEGVRNVLAITGDPPHVGDYPGSSGVYDVDAIGLVSLLGHLNRGEDFSGKAIDAPTSFYVGVAVNPSADDLDRELERFRREGGGRRPLRDDPGALRPRLPRPLPRAARRRVADPAPRRRVAADELPARVPAPQRGARDHDPGGRAGAARRARARTRGRVGFELARQLAEESRTRAAGVYVDPAVQGAGRGP